MLSRRGFLGSILALAAAPAIVRADSLMRVVPVSAGIWVPDVAIQHGPSLYTHDMIALEALRILSQKFSLDYESQMLPNGAILRVRRPPPDYFEALKRNQGLVR